MNSREDVDPVESEEEDDVERDDGDTDDDGERTGHERKDRDGARSLRDLQEESGDEDEVDDTYVLDQRAAHEAGIDLDRTDDGEARLS